MEKQPIRRPVICTAVAIFILLVFVLHQESFSNYSWLLNFGIRRDGIFPTQEAESIKLHLKLSRLVGGKDQAEFRATGFSCSVDDYTEVCVISNPVIFDKRSITIYVSSNDENQPIERTVKPYPRREDPSAMEQVTPIQILVKNNSRVNPPPLPSCQYKHDVPAVFFSFGGFTENPFHAFNEVVIPLFITSRDFESEVRLVVTDYRSQWFRKYSQVLKQLSSYEPIVADGDQTVHCFPSAVVGLRYHDNLAVNSSKVPKGSTMESFRQFLWETYNVKVKTTLNPQKPKLLLISRRETRTFLNEDEMVKMMEKLGIQVYRALPNETSRLENFAQVVNSCDIMVGAHGAGLTNALFLPTGAVMIQIVPLGLNWASDNYFGKSAPGIGLKYIRYKVQPNETSLYNVYGPNDPIVSDPAAIWARGYLAVKEAYIDGQNFRINVSRFKRTLLKALKLLGEEVS